MTQNGPRFPTFSSQKEKKGERKVRRSETCSKTYSCTCGFASITITTLKNYICATFLNKRQITDPQSVRVSKFSVADRPQIYLASASASSVFVVLYSLSRRSRLRERLNASVLSICSSVCRQNAKKTRFSQKLNNLEQFSVY